MNLKNIFIFSMLYYYFLDNTYITIVEYCGLIIFPLYCIIDLLFYKISFDKKIHHFLGFLLCLTSYFNQDFKKEIYFLSNFEIRTEISSLFLIIKDEFEFYNNTKSLFYNINNLIFVGTFLYLRVFEFFRIHNQIIEIGYIINYNYLYYFSIFGLFYLNIYWSLIIIKKIFKMLNLKYNSPIYTRYICSFTNLIYIPMLMYHNYIVKIHKENCVNNYLYFYIFNIILSLSSYNYHSSCYRSMKKHDSYNLFDKNIFYKYEIDILSCHLNCYFFAFSILPENLNYILQICAYFSILIHSLFTIIICNPNKLKKYNDILFLANILIQYVLYCFLLDVDNTSYNIWFSNSLIGIYLIISVNTIQPFYNLNHILLHFISWFLLRNTYNYIEEQSI
jgi:hypothetical protein